MPSISKASNEELTVGSPTSVAQASPLAASALLPPWNEQRQESWSCPASAKSLRTINPIRAIVDPILATSGKDRCDGKQQISLALGDPTASTSLSVCQVALDAVQKALETPTKATGYVNACGTTEARHAVATYHSYPECSVTADNVIVASGCSGALELALTALLDPGTVLLVPKPGFPLYQVIAESHGAIVEHYKLLPSQSWQVDLEHLQQIVKRYPAHTVRGLVVNNPSNPTGSVYSEQHLGEIVDWAHRNRLPIVADEIYGTLTYGAGRFHPLARVAAGRVPIIVASGTGKQYLLPGWRVGWLVFHDSHDGVLREVEAGAKRLAQLILGASHLAQTVVPALLTPMSAADQEAIARWKEELRLTLERQAKTLCQGLSRCHGLAVIPPQGSMYAMVRIDISSFDSTIHNDIVFTKLLLEEENVVVLPGKAFGVDETSMFRVVFCNTEKELDEASGRIADFCDRHAAAF